MCALSKSWRTWLTHMCATHIYTKHTSSESWHTLKCVLQVNRDTQLSYVWRMCKSPATHMCFHMCFHMSRATHMCFQMCALSESWHTYDVLSYVRHDSFRHVTWLIHKCDMTHFFIHVIWLIRMRAMTHKYKCDASCIYVPCIIHTCAFAHTTLFLMGTAALYRVCSTGLR